MDNKDEEQSTLRSAELQSERLVVLRMDLSFLNMTSLQVKIVSLASKHCRLEKSQ